MKLGAVSPAVTPLTELRRFSAGRCRGICAGVCLTSLHPTSFSWSVHRSAFAESTDAEYFIRAVAKSALRSPTRNADAGIFNPVLAGL